MTTSTLTPECVANRSPIHCSGARCAIVPKTPSRWLAVTGGLTLGAVCGALLAAFGNVISATPASSAAAVTIAIMLGGVLDQARGAIAGAVAGVIAVAFGSVIGGSPLGVELAIAVSAGIGGWLAYPRN